MGRPPKTPQYREFDALDNCLAYQGQLLKIDEIFNNNNPVIVEVGCGKAELSLALAVKNPERNYLAIDMKADRLVKGAKRAIESQIKNIRFLKLNLIHLAEALELDFAEEVWVTFPDPWPKERSAKHRLTHPAFVSNYKRLLKDSSLLKLKTDNLPLFAWSLNQLLVDDDFQVNNLSLDLHSETDVKHTAETITFYEQKFMEQGIQINYLELVYVPKHQDHQRS